MLTRRLAVMRSAARCTDSLLISSPAFSCWRPLTLSLPGRGERMRASGPVERVVRRLDSMRCPTMGRVAAANRNVARRSFDDLIRAHEQRLRDRQPERLRGPVVDDQLELGRLLDGKVGGLGTPEDLVHVRGGPPE